MVGVETPRLEKWDGMEVEWNASGKISNCEESVVGSAPNAMELDLLKEVQTYENWHIPTKTGTNRLPTKTGNTY